jgi:hypothetical protein
MFFFICRSCVLIFGVMTLECAKNGWTCCGNRSSVIKHGVSWTIWVINLENCDIRTQTVPTLYSAPALKPILRKDEPCSHLCVKCVCILCVCSVLARVCVKCVWLYVSLHLCVPACVWCVCSQTCIRPLVFARVCVRPLVCARLWVMCVCPYVSGSVCLQTCMCMLVGAFLRAVLCEQCVGSCVSSVCG